MPITRLNYVEIFQRVLLFLLSHFHELRDKLNILGGSFIWISNLEVILYWSPWPSHWNVLIPGFTKICLLKKKKIVESIIIMMLCFIWVFQSKRANESQPLFKFGREVPLWGVRMCRADGRSDQKGSHWIFIYPLAGQGLITKGSGLHLLVYWIKTWNHIPNREQTLLN